MTNTPARDDAKERVRQAVDIVDLIGGYLALRRQGRNLVGLCPWHDDSRPSLQVNADRQWFKCWVCDVGGDVFDFVMRREGIGFREALEMLAERAGIVLTPSRGEAAAPGGPDDKRTLFRAVAWAEEQFHRHLLHSPEAESARDYLEQRGLTPASVEKFHIGFAPNQWDWLIGQARTTPFSPEVLRAAGLAAYSESSRRTYDQFRGRVMFSIRDAQGRPIAFGGRVLPQVAEQEEREGRRAAKYVNSPETRLFTKSQELYGLDIARDVIFKTRHAVVVEGYTDVVLAHQHGQGDVVAVLGTALTEQHVKLLRRYADTITLVLDGDEAGQKRSGEVLELFVAAEVDLRVLTLPDRLDPCDFVLSRSGEAFRQLVESAPDALAHGLDVQLGGVDPAVDTHRAHRAVERILSVVAKAPRLSSHTATSRRLREQQIMARLARQFQINEEELRLRLKDLRQRKTARPSGDDDAANDGGSPPAALDPLEREVIEIMLLDESLAERALEAISPESFGPGRCREVFQSFSSLFGDGRPLEFGAVLSGLGSPEAKSALIQLDHEAKQKEHAAVEAARRLEDAIKRFQLLIEDGAERERLAALYRREMDDQEEVDLLKQLFESERNRQGIPAPTDG